MSLIEIVAEPGANMLREMADQPRALDETLEAHVLGDALDPVFASAVARWLGEADEIVVAASGSSRHAGLYAAHVLERLGGVPVRVLYASEAAPPAGYGEAVMVVSQSGETADTLAALRAAAAGGARTLSITNVADSSMARESDVALHTRAGREVAIPATKSFTTQLLLSHLVALAVGQVRGGLGPAALAKALESLRQVPRLVSAQLKRDDAAVRETAQACGTAVPIVFLGRGPGLVTAAEGALKLKESAYVHAESFPAGEFRHGPIAMVDGRACAVLLAQGGPGAPGRDATLALARELRACGARVLAVVDDGDAAFADLGCDSAQTPPAPDLLAPFPALVALQRLAFHAATALGIDVDRPRNLSKAVLD